MQSPEPIRTTELKKYFGEVRAVDGISIEAARGTIVALLGPNGAGKTTTINILTTQLEPDEGTARVMGHDVMKEPNQVRRRVGITFQETSLDPLLTGSQVLRFSGELYGMRWHDIRSRVEELLDMVGLTDAASRKTKTYSGGMKRRLELARSLMHTPDVLFLDEPTLGLDPQTRQKIWEYVSQLKDELGMTLLLTTHYMDEAERLADYVYIVDSGRIVREGKPDDLVEQLGDDAIRLQGTGDISLFAARLENLDYLQSLSVSEDKIMHLGVDSGQRRVPGLLSLASKCGFVVTEVDFNKPNLGDVFFKATGREIRD